MIDYWPLFAFTLAWVWLAFIIGNCVGFVQGFRKGWDTRELELQKNREEKERMQ